MPRRRPGPLVALLCAVALLVTGCHSAENNAPDGPQRTVQTATGPVQVPADPKRIVVLWKPALAAATQLGFRPVGAVADGGTAVENNETARELVPYLPADYSARSLTIVSVNGSAEEIDAEKIIALRPDLVIGAATGNKRQLEVKSKVDRFAPVALFDWRGNSSWRQYLQDVARALNAQNAADRVVADYRQRVRQAKSALGDTDKTVSMVRIQQPGQYRLETPESFAGQVIADLGLKQPAPTRTPDAGKDYRSLSGEDLNQADADTVFALPNTSKQGSIDGLTENPLWPTLSAVRGDRAFGVNFDFWGAANYFGAQRIISDVLAADTGKLEPL